MAFEYKTRSYKSINITQYYSLILLIIYICYLTCSCECNIVYDKIDFNTEVLIFRRIISIHRDEEKDKNHHWKRDPF